LTGPGTRYREGWPDGPAWAQKLKSAEERPDALLSLSIGMAEREIALKKK
jgi:hypothetical protein